MSELTEEQIRQTVLNTIVELEAKAEEEQSGRGFFDKPVTAREVVEKMNAPKEEIKEERSSSSLLDFLIGKAGR